MVDDLDMSKLYRIGSDASVFILELLYIFNSIWIKRGEIIFSHSSVLTEFKLR